MHILIKAGVFSHESLEFDNRKSEVCPKAFLILTLSSVENFWSQKLVLKARTEGTVDTELFKYFLVLDCTAFSSVSAASCFVVLVVSLEYLLGSVNLHLSLYSFHSQI